eukprot:TRINITY_DN1404_c0_g1_i1.p1 TRINITY_DN1404_c0_g1~~TRINITY_DN1404_c0_g1_i1.p1  ORF type:complete len:1494 (+),score=343.70 TRINITY_DN1404_c0_g1_i1:134-4615(+)
MSDAPAGATPSTGDPIGSPAGAGVPDEEQVTTVVTTTTSDAAATHTPSSTAPTAPTTETTITTTTTPGGSGAKKRKRKAPKKIDANEPGHVKKPKVSSEPGEPEHVLPVQGEKATMAELVEPLAKLRNSLRTGASAIGSILSQIPTNTAAATASAGKSDSAVAPLASTSGSTPHLHTHPRAWGKLIPQRPRQLMGYSLTGPSFTIGGHSKCDLTLLDPAVGNSSLCKIHRGSVIGSPYLEGQTSRNILFVNEKNVSKGTRVPLKQGDIIKVLSKQQHFAFTFQKVGHETSSGLSSKAIVPALADNGGTVPLLGTLPFPLFGPAHDDPPVGPGSQQGASSSGGATTAAAPSLSSITLPSQRTSGPSHMFRSRRFAGRDAGSAHVTDLMQRFLARDDRKNPLKVPNAAAVEENVAKLKELYKADFGKQLIKWEDIEVSFENFPNYLGEEIKELLINSTFLFLKKPEFIQFTTELSNVCRRILLAGPPGSELYQERLIRALAKHMKANLFILGGKLELKTLPKTQEATATADKKSTDFASTPLVSAAKEEEEPAAIIAQTSTDTQMEPKEGDASSNNKTKDAAVVNRDSMDSEDKVVDLIQALVARDLFAGAMTGGMDLTLDDEEIDPISGEGEADVDGREGECDGEAGSTDDAIAADEDKDMLGGEEDEDEDEDDDDEEEDELDALWMPHLLKKPSSSSHMGSASVLPLHSYLSRRSRDASKDAHRPTKVGTVRFERLLGHDAGGGGSSDLRLYLDNTAKASSPDSPEAAERIYLEALFEFLTSDKDVPSILYIKETDKTVFSNDRHVQLQKILEGMNHPCVVIGSLIVNSKGKSGTEKSPSAPGGGIMLSKGNSQSTTLFDLALFDHFSRIEERARESSKATRVLARLFPNKIIIRPPKDNKDLLRWNKQILRDQNKMKRQQNKQAIGKILEKNRIVCDKDGRGFSTRLLKDQILTPEKIEKVVGWAVSNHIMTHQEAADHIRKLEAQTAGADADKTEATPNSDERLVIYPGAIEYGIKMLERVQPQVKKNSLKDVVTENDFERKLLSECIPPNELRVSFDNIGALDKVKATLMELVMLPLQRPELFRKGNLRKPCKGILLFGPPGTGKTMLAKAVATESGANFLNCSMSSIGSKWFGEGEKYARAVFTLASKISPCVVFIDEVDSILGSREKAGEHEAMRKIKNEFMSQWDGLKTLDNERVIVLAATNRPFDLDDAVLRRMPRRLLVDLPDADNREKILRVILADEELEPGFDWRTVADMTEGFSGSDLKNLCISAAYVPIREIIAQEKKLKADGTTSEGDLKTETTAPAAAATTPAAVDAPLSTAVTATATVSPVGALEPEKKDKGKERATQPDAMDATPTATATATATAAATTTAPLVAKNPRTRFFEDDDDELSELSEDEEEDEHSLAHSSAQQSLSSSSASVPHFGAPLGRRQQQPVIRALCLKDFVSAKKELSASVHEDAHSIAELRRWNEIYGEGGNARKRGLPYFM